MREDTDEEEVSHYLITYKPPRANFTESATPEESAVLERHFEYLKSQEADGRLILAGRTEDARFGIAVIKADSEGEAIKITDNDPAVKEGVFSGELKPFRLALGGGE
jgi:uncharacterized protein YciI